MTDWTVLGGDPVPLSADTVFANAGQLQQIARRWQQNLARTLAGAEQVVRFWRGSAGTAWITSHQRVGQQLITPVDELERAAALLRAFASKTELMTAEAAGLLTKAQSLQQELDCTGFEALGPAPFLPDPGAEYRLTLQHKLDALRGRAAELRQSYEAARRTCIRELDEVSALKLLRSGAGASDRELAVLAELSAAALDGGVDRLLRDLPAGLLAALWDDLAPTAAARLIALDPTLGDVNGIPLLFRAEANRQRAEADLQAAILAGDRPRIELIQSLLQPGSSLVLYDPVADRYGVLWGDPTAANVAVFVPGVGSDQNVPGWTRDAKTLNQASGAAVVMWKGYADPGGSGTADISRAAFTGRAKDGAGMLTAFCQDGLQLEPSQQLTVVAHSYGSVVAGVALADDGLQPARVVVAGSPGMTVDSIDGLHLKPGQFYSEHAPGDYVANNLAGFGTDPASSDFGGTRLATNGRGYPKVEGHSGYFTPGSRAVNGLAAAVTGHVRSGDTKAPSTADDVGQFVGDALYPGRELVDRLTHSMPGPISNVAHVGNVLDNNIKSVTRYVIADPGGALRKLEPWLP